MRMGQAASTFGSLFSGAGLMDLGIERAGWICRWQCEIDADARRVLARHWPGVECHEDVTQIGPATLPAVHLLAGGVPCQDWSLAGRRRGLAGKRSGLFFDFVRIADAVAPRWLLFENVFGLLSQGNGSDFATVLGEITGFRPEVPEGGWRNSGVCIGPKRSAAWRVLDLQYVGGCALHGDPFGRGPVPQRRRRVFVVADSRRGAGPVQVLFEPESLPGDLEARREAGEGVAPSVTPGARRASGNRAGEQLVASTLGGGAAGSGWRDDLDRSGAFVAASLTAGMAAGDGVNCPGRRREDDVNLAVVPFDMRQASRGDKMTNNRGDGACSGGAPGTGIGEAGDPSPSLADTHTPAVAYQCHGSNVGPMGTVRAGNGGLTGGVPFIVNAAESCATQSHARESDVARSLDTTGGFAANQGGTVVAVKTNQTNANGSNVSEGPAFGLKANESVQAIQSGMVVRRLLPVECLRLMGAPDTHLDLNPPLSDSAKYRLCGNGVGVTVATWIARRIKIVDQEGTPS